MLEHATVESALEDFLMTHKEIWCIARLTGVLYFKVDRLKSCGVIEHYGSKTVSD